VYSKLLDDVRTYMPLDQLVVGDFEIAARSGLLSDFMDKTGLLDNISLPTEGQSSANASMPHWSTLFLLRCNQAGVPDQAFLDVRRALAQGVRHDDFPRFRPGLDLATPEERETLRKAAKADADRLLERHGVTLSQRTRDPLAYRSLDEEDIDAIREALAERIPKSALEALRRI
jgi:hypothetical protein